MFNLKVSDIIAAMEEWAPQELAYDWDNVGLQLGDKDAVVKNVMITLDVIEKVVDEAIANDINLIISHHPLFFQPLTEINFTEPKGKVIKKLIDHNISVYTAHTNLDIADGGVNDMLMEKLDLEVTDVLIPTKSEKLYKLSIFVPDPHLNDVKQALGKAGAGSIGNYSDCTFEARGLSSFKPLEDANPYIGEENKIQAVNETKVETIITESQLNYIIKAAEKAHPYEEMAYDLIVLERKGKVSGIGRLTVLPEVLSLKEIAEYVKDKLDVPNLRYVGDPSNKISSIAIVGGSGKGFIQDAVRRKVDLYITGDLSYHDAQDAEELGLNLIDPGHHVEEVMKESTKRYLEGYFQENLSTLNFSISNISTEPFKFIK
ncbi:Nif3-like dinuclear metal center hexameric protein [Saliterribacillus persicus]|uniref:GTP cyclohydrolase 1 type 2 homolog n=1 Tax=Saliterribacillus persicus TaxID=930114 RepID=A0A368XE89_9BACI|nr:dinuclear metal center YbgI/SA1388 family protein [Saliterribacillus persicus]